MFKTGIVIRATLDQGRWVDDGDIEFAPIGAQRLHAGERVITDRFQRQIIEPGTVLRDIERRLRRIEADRRGGAIAQRGQAPGADVADDIQQAAALHVTREPRAVVAVIEEDAGNLSARERTRETNDLPAYS